MPSLIVFDVLELSERWIIFVITGIYLFTQKDTLIWIKEVCSFAFFKILFVTLTFFALAYVFIESEQWYYLMFCFIIYPFVSVPIQEFFFRYFFFKRYSFLPRFILRSLNIFAFVFYHGIYGNKEAVIFSFFGGIFFTEIYNSKRSFTLVCIVHGALGVILFLSGFLNSFTDLFVAH